MQKDLLGNWPLRYSWNVSEVPGQLNKVNLGTPFFHNLQLNNLFLQDIKSINSQAWALSWFVVTKCVKRHIAGYPFFIAILQQ